MIIFNNVRLLGHMWLFKASYLITKVKRLFARLYSDGEASFLQTIFLQFLV